MLSPVFEFFEKLIEQFTWKRLLFTLSMLLIISLLFIIYESYTGHFMLSRLHNTVDLLQKSSTLPGYITEESNKELSNIFKSVAGELDQFSTGSSTAFSLHPTLLKSLAALSPWLFLTLIFLLVGTENNREALTGLVILAVPFSIIGGLLPDFSYSWINYLAYPIGHCAIALLVVMLWQKNKHA